MTEADFEVTSTMIHYGGAFVAKLGHLYRFADAVNQAKLKAAFPEYWATYTELATLKRQQKDVATS